MNKTDLPEELSLYDDIVFPDIKFNLFYTNKSIKISNGGKTVSGNHDAPGWAMTTAEPISGKKRYYWQFKLEECDALAHISIGITNRQYLSQVSTLHKAIGYHDVSAGLYQLGYYYMSDDHQQSIQVKTKLLVPGDIVGILYDKLIGRAIFFVNGISCGPSMKLDFGECVYPGISIFNKGYKVTVMDIKL